MNPIFRLSFLAILLAGCATYSPLTDKGGPSPDCAADASPSPISEEQAWKISGRLVTEREGWAEYQPGAKGLIDVVSYRSRRINNGAWLVMARRGITDSQGKRLVYKSGPSILVVVSKFGTVTHYDRVDESKPLRAARTQAPVRFTVN